MFLTTDQLTSHSGKNLRKLFEKIEINVFIIYHSRAYFDRSYQQKSQFLDERNKNAIFVKTILYYFLCISGEIHVSWVYWSSFNSSQAILSFLYHNSLLITNHSWILTIHKDRIFWKKSLKTKKRFSKTCSAKNLQAVTYILACIQYILLSMIYFNHVAFFDDFCHTDQFCVLITSGFYLGIALLISWVYDLFLLGPFCSIC